MTEATVQPKVVASEATFLGLKRFNLIMGFIAAFQVFAVPFVMMDGVNEPPGGPGGSMLFAATYIYLKAFQDWEMGYACAMALIFFLLIVTLTLTLMKISERRVHYAGR